MAVTHTNYFTNAIVGQPMAGNDVDIFASDALPKLALGTRYVRGDGNTYVYSHFGASAPCGAVVSTDKSESHLSGVNAFTAPATAGKPPFENINMGAIGSHYILGNLTIKENQLAGGYLTVYGNTGLGLTYRVRGNTSWAGTTSRIELYEPLHQAIDATSDIVISGCPYANLEPSLTSATGAVTVDNLPVGVVTRNQSANTYGWICTKGITAVRTNGNTTAGMPLMLDGLGGKLGISNEVNGSMSAAGKIAPRALGVALDTLAAGIGTARVNFE